MKNAPLILLIKALALYGFFFISAIFLIVITGDDQVGKAIITMGMLLVVFWCFLCGSLILKYKDSFNTYFNKLSWPWYLKFIFFCTCLALAEEAITTSLTNTIPHLFGVSMEHAHITASSNYIEVVLFHSVIVFIPMFCVWAWLISRYAFKAIEVFLLFGLVGLFAEALSSPSQILNPMWIFIYGLFIYWPAYATEGMRGRIKPRLKHYILAFFLPILSAAFSAPIVIWARTYFNIELFPGV